MVDQLYRVQRSACIGVTGALRTSPSEALNTVLHLVPIDLHIMAISACGAVRLGAYGCWKSRTYGHARILGSLPPVLTQPSDYTTPHVDFDRAYKVRFPSRGEWARGNLTDNYDIRIYTDGSKMSCGVGSGVFCDELGISISHRLPDECSVFQAEIFAIVAACRVLGERNIHGNVGVFVDSQAALMSLDSCTTTSILVRQCRNELSRLGRQSDITLIWVPAHRDYYGNEQADELARKGSALNISNAVSVAIPLGYIKSSIFRLFLHRAEDRWRSLDTCSVARLLWPSFDGRRTMQLINRDRKSVSRLVALITGHWTLGRHASRLGLPFNECCRSCGDREREETVFHLLCECPALSARRNKFLGGYILSGLGELSGSRPDDLLRYLTATGWI